MHQNQKNSSSSIKNNFSKLSDLIKQSGIDYKLIVGLGNPGKSYQNNWHNLGQIITQQIISTKYNRNLLAETNWKNPPGKIFKDNQKKIIWAIPETYMNNSGDFVSSVMDYYNIKKTNLVVIFDDLDLEIKNNKFQWKKKPKVHNGVNSVVAALGSNEFYSYRIGAFLEERRLKFRSGQDYLLSNIPKETKQEIIDSVLSVIDLQ